MKESWIKDFYCVAAARFIFVHIAIYRLVLLEISCGTDIALRSNVRVNCNVASYYSRQKAL